MCLSYWLCNSNTRQIGDTDKTFSANVYLQIVVIADIPIKEFIEVAN